MLLLITSLETAGPSGKSALSKFRRNFIVYLRSGASLSFTQDEGQRRDPMISGRGDQALGPLCVSTPTGWRLPSADRAHQLAASRGPPLRLERGNC
jgi:hypothetical protein